MAETDADEPVRHDVEEDAVTSSGPGTQASIRRRLDEFGWNALPIYLAVLGVLFLTYGLASGDLRAAGYGALFIALGLLKRRHQGAWLRRY